MDLEIIRYIVAAVLLCIMVAIIWILSRRPAERAPRPTLGQWLVRVLYRIARVSLAVAVAADKAVLHYDLTRQRIVIEPENELARG